MQNRFELARGEIRYGPRPSRLFPRIEMTSKNEKEKEKANP